MLRASAISINAALKVKMWLQRLRLRWSESAPPRRPESKKKKTVNDKRKTSKHYNICVIEQRDRHVRQMHNFDRGNE